MADYQIAVLDYDPGRNSLVGIFQKAGAFYAGVISPTNGTVVAAGAPLTLPEGYSILEGASAWNQGGAGGQATATLNVLLTKQQNGAPNYILLSVNPWTGEVLHNRSLSNPHATSVAQLSFA